ncbi:MAG TPA: hypothetical protein VJU61_05530, partial [Polyangiaceae bacterium]|nr:hypothetical protein [Polyangiaceae bacterium]
SGRALRTLFELMFQPLVDGAESALVGVKRFFQSIIIGTLYVTLALLRLQVWWKKTFSEGFFTAAPWEKLGSLIVDGIVNGMNAADEWLMDAIRGLGDKAMQAFKETLGIASPSRVFTDLGLQIPAGVEQGIEKGTPAAQEAAGNMVGAVGAAGRGGGGGASIEIGSIVIQTNATDAGGIARDIEMELRRVLEGVGFMLGAPA